MKSFKFNISDKDRTAALFIGNVQEALLEAALNKKISQSALAKKLGVDRSFINRIVKGKSNLTLRSLAEISWALGYEPAFSLTEDDADQKSNYKNNIISVEYNEPVDYRVETIDHD